MNNNFGNYILILLALFWFSKTNGQAWEELKESDKRKLFSAMQENNKVEGCFNLKYSFYNFSINSTPINTVSGTQCHRKGQNIINVYGHNFVYSDSKIIIDVDSINKMINIAYNLAYTDLMANGQAAINLLIENSGLVYKMEAVNQTIIKVLSIEANGIKYYILYLDENKLLNKMEIHYDEQKIIRYNEEPEINEPIVVVEFRKIKTSKYLPMMSTDFFLNEQDERIFPSKHFVNYKINDTRIRNLESR